MSREARAFLDANVLFSAAYHEGSRLRRLWSLEAVELLTSGYALEEARRNLSEKSRLEALEELAAGVRVLPEALHFPLPVEVELPAKDRPILLAAMSGEATHLLTGDVTHFRPLYGRRIGGVVVLRPSTFLERFD